MLIKPLLTQAKTCLRDAGIPSYAIDAELLLAHILETRREAVIGNPTRDVTQGQQDAYNALITRRAAREPMAHILGKREFWGREFKVTHATLDPRPDSETLIETVISWYKGKKPPKKILDLGTGTGCLLLTLLSEFTDAYGVGVDKSSEALAVATYNAKHLGLEKRTQLLLQCWAEGVNSTFDVIISNPPYIRDSDIAGLEPEVSHYEPYIALSGGEDGLHCYRELIPQLPGVLNPGGLVVLEVGIGQADAVSALLDRHGLLVQSISHDLAGIARCVAASNIPMNIQ